MPKTSAEWLAVQPCVHKLLRNALKEARWKGLLCAHIDLPVHLYEMLVELIGPYDQQGLAIVVAPYTREKEALVLSSKARDKMLAAWKHFNAEGYNLDIPKEYTNTTFHVRVYIKGRDYRAAAARAEGRIVYRSHCLLYLVLLTFGSFLASVFTLPFVSSQLTLVFVLMFIGNVVAIGVYFLCCCDNPYNSCAR